jgi:uncharacterized protein
MKIGVAYATPQRQVWLTLDIPAGATIADAIARSALTDSFPELDLERQRVGVFGKMATLDTVLTDGDRVEIYRPLTVDPKNIKRKAKTAEPAPT